MYLLNKCVQIHHLFHCMSLHDVLCLCTWQHDNVLFLRAPSDGSHAHVEWVPRNQVPMWLPSPICITKSIQDCVSMSAESQPEVLHVAKVCSYSLHTFPVSWTWILNGLRQDPNCKHCIQARDYYGPQDTANCLCIWHILHSEFLCQGWWALIFTECNSWVHWHTDSFCIGKSKIFDHPFNVAMLVDRYGPCASISLDFKS